MILEDILKILKTNTDKAYTIGDKSYTYNELYKFICNIYFFLISRNKDKRPVIVYGKKDIYMKATFLACSFAGITYVPIDKSMPNERVEEIISDVNPDCIIGDFKYKNISNISSVEIFDMMNKEIKKDIENIMLKPEDIYYIVFTSGSTGKPKGVKVTYKNLDSCVKWLQDITKIDKGIILNQANFSFDLSVADLYLSLITGSEHYILDNSLVFDFNYIHNSLKKSNATLAVMTPSFADLLLLDKNFGKQILPNLETILFCGEKLLQSTVTKLYSRFDNIKIINSYGPTECTFAVTSIEIKQEMLEEKNLPVGIAKNDVGIYILDKNKNEVKDGIIGEILITGESVASGYLNNKNNNSFIKYNNNNGYLTGDLGYIKNNILYVSGRNDNQIKYKGYRIDLLDIEENLYKLGYIDKARVLAKEGKNNEIVKIYGFVKLKQDIEKSESDIKTELSKKLPEYMIPNIKILQQFSINNNGKVDNNDLRRIVYGR